MDFLMSTPNFMVQGTVLGSQDGFGRVTYEHSGECFFLPYAMEDVQEPNIKIKTGDQVMFSISTDPQ